VRDIRHHGEFLRAAGRNTDAERLMRSAAEKARSLEFGFFPDDDGERSADTLPA
jgi:hypothetical protein